MWYLHARPYGERRKIGKSMANEVAPESDGAALRKLSEERLLAQCRWEAFRGPGPGGQKRNKTSSAVRLVHMPTGLSAIAHESRSQAQNRRKALMRLRHRLALELRQPIDPATFVRPGWFEALLGEGRRLELGQRSEDYLPALGLVLDVLEAAGGSVSEAARLLGISTGNLVRFLEKDEKAWGRVNQMRKGAGLKALRSEGN